MAIALQSRPPLFRIDVVFENPSIISLNGGPPIPISGPPIMDVRLPEPMTLLLWGLPLAPWRGCVGGAPLRGFRARPLDTQLPRWSWRIGGGNASCIPGPRC
jgi:hypothetical protein